MATFSSDVTIAGHFHRLYRSYAKITHERDSEGLVYILYRMSSHLRWISHQACWAYTFSTVLMSFLKRRQYFPSYFFLRRKRFGLLREPRVKNFVSRDLSKLNDSKIKEYEHGVQNVWYYPQSLQYYEEICTRVLQMLSQPSSTASMDMTVVACRDAFPVVQ